MEEKKHIVIVEPSVIIREGISAILRKSDSNYFVSYFDSITQLQSFKKKDKVNLIIVNSNIISSNFSEINTLKESFINTKIIGLISTYNSRILEHKFDDYFYLNDKTKDIVNTVINSLVEDKIISNTIYKNNLSDRETDVLKQLVLGNMNKSIADNLNISIHTVITHRKNITKKLGIKSTAAMAIYAVANNIIEIDSSLDEFK